MTFTVKIAGAAVGLAMAAAIVPAAAAPYSERAAVEYGTPRPYGQQPMIGEAVGGFIGGATLGLIAPPGFYNNDRAVPYAYQGGTLYDYGRGGDRLHNGVANF